MIKRFNVDIAIKKMRYGKIVKTGGDQYQRRPDGSIWVKVDDGDWMKFSKTEQVFRRHYMSTGPIFRLADRGSMILSA